MTTPQKVYYISFIILLVCIALTGFIYLYTGQVVIAILFAPPIIHWMLKKRKSQKD